MTPQEEFDALLAGLTRYPDDRGGWAALADFVLERNPVFQAAAWCALWFCHRWYTCTPDWVYQVECSHEWRPQPSMLRELETICLAAGLSVRRSYNGTLLLGHPSGDQVKAEAVWIDTADPEGVLDLVYWVKVPRFTLPKRAVWLNPVMPEPSWAKAPRPLPRRKRRQGSPPKRGKQ